MRWIVIITMSVAAAVGCALSYKRGRVDGVREMRRMMTSYIDSDSMFV